MNGQSNLRSLDNSPETDRSAWALQAAGIGIWDADLQQNTFYWSAQSRLLFNAAENEPASLDSMLACTHPADRTRVDQALQEVIAGGQAGRYEVQFRRREAAGQALQWLHCKGQVYQDADGQPARFSGIVQLLHQEAQLAASPNPLQEAPLRTLIDNTPDLITRRDKDLRLLFANTAFQTKARINPDLLLGTNNLEIGEPESVTRPYMRQLQQVFADGKPQAYYSTYPSDEGDIHYYSQLVPEFGLDGSVQSVLGVARDITALKNAEQQQKKTADLLQSVLNVSLNGICVLTCIRDEQGEIIDFEYRLANRAVELLTQCDTLVGQSFSARYPAYKKTGLFEDFRTVVETGQPIEGERHHDQAGFDDWYDTSIVKLDDGVLFTFRNITADVAARQQILASETLFKNVTSQAPTGLWLSDENGGLTYLNDTLVEWTGMSYQSLLGAGWANAIIEEDRQRSAEVFLSAVAERTHYDIMFQITKYDGQLMWCRAAGDPYYHPDGQFAGYAGFCMDIDELVKSREALQQSEAKLRSVIASAPAAIGLLMGRDLVIEMPNQTFIDVVGRGTDIIGKPLREVMPELENQPFLQIMDEVFTSGTMFQNACAPVDINQNGVLVRKYYNITYTPFFDSGGQVYALLGISIDVSSEVEAKKKVEASEILFRSIVEQAPMAIALFNSRDMLIEVGNENMFAVWDTDKSVLGQPLLKAIPALSGQPFERLLQSVYTTGEPVFGNGTLVRIGNQEDTYFNFAFTPLRNEGGDMTGVMVLATDITQQMLDRQKLEETEKRLQGAIELAQLGTWEIDVLNNKVSYSDRVMEWFGFSGPETALMEAYNPVHEKDRDRITTAVLAAIAPGSSGVYDEAYTIVAQHTRHERIIHAQGKTFFDEQGNPVKLSGTVQDVTEQRKTQEALEREVELRTQELQLSIQDLQRSNQNLQQFAYIASHDLQEPLRKIQSFSDILKIQYASQLGDGVQHLDRMQGAASRMSALIKDLLSFSRISTQQNTAQLVPLTDIVQLAIGDLDLLIQEADAQIRVEPLPVVQGDRSQLVQLFQNLLSNALKFSRADLAGQPTKPEIRVTTRTLAAGALPPSVKPARLSPTYFCISVSDNGIGFDQKYVDRIFQVFQRLHGKSQYAGTGIGLAICDKVAANHGGAITARSQPGQGATFSVYFPILADRVTTPLPLNPPSSPGPGSGIE